MPVDFTDHTPGAEGSLEAAPDEDGAADQRRGLLASRITTAVVKLFAEYVGRGPTKGRTLIEANVVTVILEDTLTKAEHRLLEKGRAEAVISTRRLYQTIMRDDLANAIESLTGRSVLAFLSDQSVAPDYAVETFILSSKSAHDGVPTERPESEAAV
jgi:uncharacterized protein YbcI